MSPKSDDLRIQSTHPEAEEVLKVLFCLGMPSKLKKIASDLDIYDLLKRGLPSRSVKSLIRTTGLTAKDIGTVLLITERKLKLLLSGRVRSTLTPIESSTVWQFASVFVRAEQVFGSKDAARDWLFFKPRGTVYRRPIDLLALPIGVEFVSTYMHQIDAGVYV